MKYVYRVAYLAAIALLCTTPLVQSMEPAKRTKEITISPSAPHAMPVIVRQMVLDLPVLNTNNPSYWYNKIRNYFKTYSPTLLQISTFIQSGAFRPGAELAAIIRNRKINNVPKEQSKDLLGDYLYQIAKFHKHERTMAWLDEYHLANPQNNFFQRMFQISLNQDTAQPNALNPDQNNFKPADAEFWLSLGAQVNLQDDRGMTPLMRRAQLDGEAGTAQMKFLLEHGANPNLQNENGNTALHLARPNVGKMNLLIAHGASTTIANKAGHRP